MKHTRKLALLAVVPLALTLSACKSQNTVAIGTDGSMTVTMDIRDDKGLLKMGGVDSCDVFGQKIDESVGSLKQRQTDTKIEDLSKNGVMECRFTAYRNAAADGKVLTETANSYIFRVSPGQSGTATAQSAQTLKNLGLDFTLTVQMPGKILRAQGAEIKGNTATFNSLDIFTKKTVVEGEKKPTGREKAVPAQKKADAGETSPGHNAAYMWLTGGIAVLAVFLAAVFFFGRKKKNRMQDYRAFSRPQAGENAQPADFFDSFSPQNADTRRAGEETE